MAMDLPIVVALMCLLGIPAVGIGHPGHDHKIMGMIQSIDGQHVLVKTSDGHDRSFEITSLTKVVRGKTKSDARELKVGMRVVVNVGDGKEPLKAKEIQYSEAAPTKKL